MGDKNIARATARKAGVPVTPGSDGLVETEQEALKVAKKIGYPVMIKAVAGRRREGACAPRTTTCRSCRLSTVPRMEAEKAFGNSRRLSREADREPAPHRIQIMA
jgi:acetyl-CoA carboxylase biotin carboxylase subunit